MKDHGNRRDDRRHHPLRSSTMPTSSSVRSPSPIELRTSGSTLASTVCALFLDVWIKIGLECLIKSSALPVGSLSSWNYRCGQIRKISKMEKMSCTCALWRRQHHFRIIRIFAFICGTLLSGVEILIHLPSAKFAGDVGGSTPEDGTLVFHCTLFNACDFLGTVYLLERSHVASSLLPAD